jgi:dTDP-4-amino-4,6-dideoxygalactose transaminase
VGERLFADGLCLPSGSGMTEEQRQRVITAFRSAFGA